MSRIDKERKLNGRRAVRAAVEALESRRLLAADLTTLVNPFIGTDTQTTPTNMGVGNAGEMFPGAVAPFGMMQWSPDTTNTAGNYSGYDYQDSTIKGFSLTHFSGRGLDYLKDIPFMPVLGTVTQSPQSNPSAFQSAFTHVNESAAPGYYKVKFNNNITTELAAAVHSGMAQFTFPAQSAVSVLVKLGSAYAPSSASLSINVSGKVVSGSVKSHISGGGASNPYTIYFYAVFDQPFTAYGTWSGSTLTANSTSTTSTSGGAYLTFNTSSNQVVHVKVGISYVSVANAQANLAAEIPAFDFTSLKTAAHDAWNTRLNSIVINTGGTANEKTQFYTALYHTMIHPGIMSDVNGQYMGFDNAVHTLASGEYQMTYIPGWDTYRAEYPLLSLVASDMVDDVVKSLIRDAQQGGGAWPRWVQGPSESHSMEGDPASVIVTTALSYGISNFDTAAAKTIMLNTANNANASILGRVGREGLADYLSYGYVTTNGTGGSDRPAAETLEYAISDFAIAQYAAALGDTATYNTYLARAENWRNLFNSSVGLVKDRDINGNFIATSPPDVNTQEYGFAEGDSRQYTWMVPQAWSALISALGGPSAAATKLDSLFTQLNAGSGANYAFMGNEYSLFTPYAYLYMGMPWKTQDVERRIRNTLYTNTPGGLPGNDDAGSMSAAYIFNTLGVFPGIPGVGGLMIGSPLFSDVTIHLGNNNTIRITAANAGTNNPYIQSMTVNGTSSQSLWIPVSTFGNGSNKATTLSFTMGATANTSWGTAANSAPPTIAPATTAPTAPTSLTAKTGDALKVTLSWKDNAQAEDGYTIQRSTDGSSFTTIATVGMNVQTYSDTVGSAGLYYYRILATNSAGNSSASNVSSVLAVNLPNPWTYGDIGSTGGTGSSNFGSGTYTINGAGAGIGGTSDSFQFMYQSLSGDGQIVAKVTAVGNTNANAKAGVMIRNSLSGNAAFAAMLLSPTSSNSGFNYRSTAAGAATQVANTQAAPYWVKLVRTGDTFSAYKSNDGSTWTLVGTSQTIAMGATVYIGLAVSGAAGSTLNTSTFQNVSVVAPRNGLIGYWKFDEGTGTTSADAAGASTATLSGTTWSNTAKSGKALSFDGTSGYVSANSNSALNAAGTNLTVAAWINPTSWPSTKNPRILEKGDDNQYRIVVEGGLLKFSVAYVGEVSIATLPALNAWTHLAGTYDGQTLTLYVNGVAVASSAASGYMQATTSPLYIGTLAPTNTKTMFTGLIDDVRVYNRALSSSEVTAVMSDFGTSQPQISATPATPVLVAASDTGASNSDRITNLDNTSGKTLQFTVGGTVAGATVAVYADGAMIGSAVATGTTTTVTTDGTVDLTDGSHSITATQTESGKSVSAASASLLVVVDTVGPSVSSSSPSGTVGGSQSSVVFNFSEAIDTATYALASDVSFTGPSGAITPSSSAWTNTNSTLTVSFSAQSTAGGYTMNVGPQIADVAGNLMNQNGNAVLGENPGDRYSATFTITTATSATPGTPVLAAASDTGVSADSVTNLDNSAAGKTLQFVVSGTVSGATVTVYADGTAIGTATASGTSTTITTNGTFDLTDGTHSITARQTESGKTQSNASAALQITVDTAGPRVTSSSPSGTIFATPSSVSVTFNEAIDTSSFSIASDLTFTGPSGAITLSNPVWTNGNTTLTVSFASQSTPGTYTLVVGPQIADIASNAMNQDNDAINGEATADQYTGTFTIQSVSSGPVGLWQFEEGSGTSTADSSGNGLTGTLASGTTWTTGHAGGALSFNGTTSAYVRVLDNAALNPTSAITVAAWINPTTWGTGANRRILQKSDSSDVGYMLRVQSNQLNFNLSGVGSVSYATLPTTGAWHLVAGTYDGTTMKLWVDNVVVASTTISGSINIAAGSSLAIGAKVVGDTNANNFFNGKIDDVRIYSRAISATEMTAIYQGTATSPVPSIPVLASASDSGVAGDSRTNRDNSSTSATLQFSVGGTVAGASVTVYADGVAVGAATANGITTVITTNGSSSLADGSHLITATQTVSGQSQSAVSNPLTLVIDTTAPTVSNTAPNGVVSGNQSSISFTFSEAIDVSSFSLNTAVESFTGPSGSLTPTGSSWSNGNTTLTVTFSPQAATGTYTMVLGSAVQDVAGNSLASYSAGFTIQTSTGPVGAWQFEEGSGTATADTSGNGLNGTLGSGVTWSTGGHTGKALSFNASSTSYVQIADAAQLNPTASLTLAAWTKATSWTGGNRRILEKGDSLDNQYMLIMQSGSLLFSIYGVGSVTAAPPTTGAWHLIVGTYDGATMTLWIDGTVVASTAATGAINVTANPLGIGNKLANPTANNSFSGLIDDVRVYDRALSTQEINSLYLGQSTTPGTPDLLNASDTGASSSDNLTNINNAPATLQFSVDNTVARATVTIYSDGVAIGSAVATGSTTIVTTNGTAQLLDGAHSVTARQTESGNAESVDSAVLAISIDSAGAAVAASTPSGENVVGQSSLTFNFSDEMNPASFDLSDIAAFTGPGGTDLLPSVTGFSWADSNTLVINFATQSANGSYTMTIGPRIQDSAGNSMDQDGDGVNGESADDQYSATFSINTTVTSATPLTPDLLDSSDTGAGNNDNITDYNNAWHSLQFSVGGTVAGATVTIYADGTTIGSAVATGTTTIVTTDSAFRLVDGLHAITARQQESGKAASADSLALTVAIDSTGGSIASASPTGTVLGAVASITVNFAQSMNTASFDESDLVSFTDPNGTSLLGAITNYSWSDDSTLVIQFASQNTPGTYTIVVAPTIQDVAGNPLDQNQNGTNGQNPGDRFTAVFTVQAVSTGPLASWQFDEGSGTSTVDASGNGQTGTLGSAVTWNAAGHTGKSPNFSASANSYVQVVDSPNLNPTDTITLSAWIKPTSWSGGNRRILEKGDASDNQYLLTEQNGQLMFSLYNIDSVTATLPSTGVWHLIVATYDGATMTIWIDGVAVASKAATGTLNVTSNPLGIGNKLANPTANNAFIGQIDDVRVYGRALTPSEIAALYVA